MQLIGGAFSVEDDARLMGGAFSSFKGGGGGACRFSLLAGQFALRSEVILCQ